MNSEMEMGRVEGVQHMAGTPLRYAVVGKFGWGGYVLRWDSMCDCGDLGIAVMAGLATRHCVTGLLFSFAMRDWIGCVTLDKTSS